MHDVLNLMHRYILIEIKMTDSAKPTNKIENIQSHMRANTRKMQVKNNALSERAQMSAKLKLEKLCENKTFSR